jgi:hypothetical protein
MMDAMQITVSSEIENRMDDKSSTASRNACDGVLMRQPWVETDMCVFSLETTVKRARVPLHHAPLVRN